MRIPFIILSYGVFAKSKMIFSYERDGVHTLPIFTDAAIALKFSQAMTDVLKKKFNDPRALHTQLCSDPKMALEMFEVITVYCPDMMQIIVDPTPPRNSESTDPSDIQIAEYIKPIDEVLMELRNQIKSGSNTEKESSDS
jgi:hypothetical protein